MKHQHLLWTLLTAVFFSGSTLLAQNVPDIMYYKFNETGQTTVVNEASSPVGTNPAPLLGGMTQGSTGLTGSALVGTGATSGSAYVNTGWATSLSGDWTIAFWTSNVPTSTTLYYIFGDVNAGGFRCFTNGVAGAGNWILRGGFTDVLITGGATVAPHMMHYVYDSSVPEIRAYLDGALVNTVPQGIITINGTGPFKVGGYSTSTGLDGNMDEFRIYSSALAPEEILLTYNQTLPLIQAEYPYCQDFEGNDGNWNSGGISSTWEHGVPAGTAIATANSGTQAWVTNLDGDHNNNEYSYVFSPKFDLSSLIDPVFKASVIHELQSTDGVAVQVSTDSMNTWSTLGSSSSPAPWYNSNSISSLAFFGNQNGWTNTINSWTDMQHSLLPYANDTSVFFRFVLAADGSNANEGFGFDDIVVAESNDVNFVELIAPDSVCGASNTEIQAVLCNNSVGPASGFTVVLDTGGANISVPYVGSLPVCGCDTMTLLTLNTASGGNWNLESYIQNTGDVNSSNDSAFASMFIYPIPTVTVSGSGNYCQGEIAEITFIFNGTQPYNISFTDGTSPTFLPNIASDTFVAVTTTGGVFEVLSLTDASGCPGDTGGFFGQANIVFNPAPTLDLGPDSTVCGTYPLDAGAGLTAYAWNTGATTQVLSVSQSGTYSVTVTDANGCTNSDDIELVVNPLPIVDLGDTVICEGGSFTFNAGAPYLSYLWDDGSTGQLLSVTGVASVSVTVTDFNMCQGVGMGSITAVVPNPTPTVSNNSGLAPVTLDAGSGYSSYSWVTNATTQTIDVFASGTYTVTVTDANGCRGTASGNASIWPNGVKDITLNAEGIAVYPNPAKERVTIAIAKEGLATARLQVLDINGRAVTVTTIDRGVDGLFEWSIPEQLTTGQYLLRIADVNGTEIGTHTLLIQ